MLDAMFEYTSAGQAVLLTPFIMMGAMSPVTIPASLVQQIAETLSGVALTQLIRPGAPVIFGSFLSNVDMQSGSPQFGTPESAIGLLCTGQIARHFGLPFRSGGGLNASQTVDAQAGYESLMTMQATFALEHHSAEHQRPRRVVGEAVDVEPLTDTNLHGSTGSFLAGHSLSGPPQVGGVGDLAIVNIAIDHHHGSAASGRARADRPARRSLRRRSSSSR